MNIIYGYSNCTDKLYYTLYSDNKKAILRPDQKYHGLLIHGLSRHVEKINCISGLPINRKSVNRLLVREEDETENNINYHYLTTVNLPVLRRIMVFLGTLINTIKTKKEKETVAICDCLNVANAYGMTIGAHLKRIPVIMIVTDLPDMVISSSRKRKIYNRLFRLADGFVFLTEQMNERINKNIRPYIVLEGHVDINAIISDSAEKYEVSDKEKVIIYAGSLRKKYGIQDLVKGFQRANIENAELWIYGDGDYREELEKEIKSDKRIKYMGVRDNSEVVNAESKAALLVNPRPSAPEYTKYSFPSKNMEYMVSGTPVLTTNLPGMPKEYQKYVYIIEHETVDGIAEALRKVFSDDISVRQSKALSARKFVLEEKNNVAQAGKIVSFILNEIFV